MAKLGFYLEVVERREVECHIDHAIVEVGPLGEADGSEHQQHVVVVRQCLGNESTQATSSGHQREPFEQQSGHPFSMVVVGHGERDLSFVGLVPHEELADADQLVVDGHKQRDVMRGITRGHGSEFLFWNRPASSEEPVVGRRVTEALVECAYSRQVGWSGGRDVNWSPVGEHRRSSHAGKQVVHRRVVAGSKLGEMVHSRPFIGWTWSPGRGAGTIRTGRAD
jgi:hypothetical protein